MPKIFQNIEEAASPKPYPIFSFSEILFVIDLFLVCNRNVAQNNLLFYCFLNLKEILTG